MVWSIVLWVLQGLLALQFLFHGYLFLAPPADMVAQMDASYAPGLRMFIGVAELLGSIGLILPAATRVLPWLTPLAAAGLMIVTASATVVHLSRSEPGNAVYTAVLFLLVTFVGYMRWRVRPVSPRGSSSAPGQASNAPAPL